MPDVNGGAKSGQWGGAKVGHCACGALFRESDERFG